MRGSANIQCAGCRTHLLARSLTLAGLLASLPASVRAQTALPQGGSVVSGQASIAASSADAVSITQNSSRAIVNWNSFSVGSGGSVNFIQPTASSAILNRVTGSTSSTIAGAITANGQVFLVNPNGIAITPSGTVQVGGGFVASTLDIANGDFNAGNLAFSGNGASAGVSNAGSILSAPGGFVGLIGGTVSNSGTISVPLGKVGLGSGEQVTLDPTGDGFLQVALPTGAVAANGGALVDVSGRIRAAGGSIEIKAATAQAAVRDAVNVSGALSARSVSGRSGNIVLDGGAGGNVVISGKLKATGGKQSKGGSILVTGSNIGLHGALVDVSGGTGGGTVEIGGGPQGNGALLQATTTSVDSASLIKADATENGNGGSVTVWSDDATTFAGHISARGGAQGGNGGQAEVSGKVELNLTGDYSKTPLADLSALRGTTGTILFDPGTVDIIDQTSLANQSALNGPDTFTAQFISGQLASANVTIDTNNATGANGAAGDINLMSNAQISWSSGNSLTLNAAGNINFAAGASITGSGGGAGLVLRADSGGSGIGTVNFAGGIQVSLIYGSEQLFYNPASNRTVANGGTNNAAGTVNGSSFTGATPGETWGSFISASAGGFTPYMLVNNVYDLQNINNNLSANYALGRNIDASATSGWNAGAGLIPLGTDAAGNVQGAGFTGSFNGAGNTISNLTVNRGSGLFNSLNDAGLFGYVGGGSIISNVGLINVSIAGDIGVGGLAGVNAGGTITASYATGAVTGQKNVGGLVGQNAPGGVISNSYATSTVSAANITSNAGGLVGENDGSIVSSYATGATSGLSASSTGGLVGQNTGTGTVANSYFDTNTTGQTAGIGSNSNGGGASATGLTTATFQDGSLPAGLSSATWSATNGSYPALNWQAVSSPPPATTPVVITATDANSGTSTYGQAPPAFSYTVTDGSGNILCTSDCSAYFSGTPLIDTTLSTATSADTSVPGYVALGTLLAQAGYSFKFVNDTIVVTPASVTVTALGGSSGYGSSPSNPGLSATGLQNGQNVSALTGLSNSFGISNTSNAGSYTLDVAGTLTNSNYTVTSTTNGSWTVNPAPVSVTALGGSSTYGSSPANPGLSATGLQNGQSVSALTGLSNSFGISNASNAGSYTLDVAGTLTNSNYTVTSTTNGSWTVNPASVSVTAFNGSSIYGSSPANAGLSATGLQNGQSVSVLTGLSNGISNSSNAGSYTADVTGTLTNPNYTVGSTTNGSWTVNPAPVSVTALGGSSSYGSSPANPGLSATGLQNGQNASVLTGLSNSFGISNTSNAGSYTLDVAGSLTNSNYTVASTTAGSWTVNPASVSVTALGGSSTYGSSPANPGLSATGLQNGQNASVLTGLSNSFGINNTSNAGSYTLDVAGTLTNSNYTVASTTNGSWTVNPASISVTALGGSSTYGSSPANPGLSATGLQNGQNASVLTGLSNSFGISNSSNAGSYTLDVAGTLTNANYTVASTTNGSWTVNPASISVTALGGSSTYGSSPANPGLSATGLQNGQNASVLTGLSNSFGINNTSNAGTYTVNVAGTLTNANYAVSSTHSGSWTIDPAPVSVTALGGASTYGSSPANPGLSAIGLQNGQNVSALIGLRNSFGITSSSTTGNYTMEVTGTLTNPNYTVTNTNNGSWIVNPVSPALRGSLTGGSSRFIPGMSVAVPPTNGGAGVLNGLAGPLGSINTGNHGSVGGSGRVASAAKADSGAPAGAGNAGTSPANPAPVVINTPAAVAGASPNIAAASDPKAACRSGSAGGTGEACGPAAAPTPRGRIGFALTNFNRDALAEAINREFSEVTDFRNGPQTVLTLAMASTSLGLTVGIVSWLLRGGALLGALLSSMPLWREFDPLPVVMRPKRRDQEEQPPSDVDRLFDDADASNYSTGDCKS